MSNQELSASVADELRWDPKVNSDTIAVSADAGVVILRGTVGSFHEKRQAKKQPAAWAARGVSDVGDRIVLGS